MCTIVCLFVFFIFSHGVVNVYFRFMSLTVPLVSFVPLLSFYDYTHCVSNYPFDILLRKKRHGSLKLKAIQMHKYRSSLVHDCIFLMDL